MEFIFECHVCGQHLCMMNVARDREYPQDDTFIMHVTIAPCDQCRANARKAGVADGRMDGARTGFDSESMGK